MEINMTNTVVSTNGDKMSKSKVCRCLFGKPDRSNDNSILKDLKKLQEKDREEAVKRWNFDILEENPCEGRFEWEVEPHAPSFYTKGYKSRVRPNISIRRNHLQEKDVNKKEDSDSDDAITRDVQRALAFEGSPREDDDRASGRSSCSDTTECLSTTQAGKPLVQTTVDDFMKKRKRPSSPDSGLYESERKSPRI